MPYCCSPSVEKRELLPCSVFRELPAEPSGGKRPEATADKSGSIRLSEIDLGQGAAWLMLTAAFQRLRTWQGCPCCNTKPVGKLNRYPTEIAAMPEAAPKDSLLNIRTPGRRLAAMNLKLPTEALDQLKAHSAEMGVYPAALARYLVLQGLERLEMNQAA